MIFPTSRERWDMDPFPANGIIEAESPETLTFAVQGMRIAIHSIHQC